VISIHVKLFAVAKDLAGTNEITLSVRDNAQAAGVLDHFLKINPRFEDWKGHLRLAVNSEYADLHHPLHDGDEVAIIPPVSGG
jgi:molybdopterin synthase sulfur carrier subunit